MKTKHLPSYKGFPKGGEGRSAIWVKFPNYPFFLSAPLMIRELRILVAVSFGIGVGLALGQCKSDCISPVARSARHWVSPPPSIPRCQSLQHPSPPVSRCQSWLPPSIPTSVPVQASILWVEGSWSFIVGFT